MAHDLVVAAPSKLFLSESFSLSQESRDWAFVKLCELFFTCIRYAHKKTIQTISTIFSIFKLSCLISFQYFDYLNFFFHFLILSTFGDGLMTHDKLFVEGYRNS